MSDLPPDLPRLRTLQTYLGLQLQQVNARIEDLEKTARTPDASPSPPPAKSGPEAAQGAALAELRWWRFVPNRGTPGGVLHRGDCHLASGGALLNLTEARLILDEGARPCDGCCPEVRLAQ